MNQNTGQTDYLTRDGIKSDRKNTETVVLLFLDGTTQRTRFLFLSVHLVSVGSIEFWTVFFALTGRLRLGRSTRFGTSLSGVYYTSHRGHYLYYSLTTKFNYSRSHQTICRYRLIILRESSKSLNVVCVSYVFKFVRCQSFFRLVTGSKSLSLWVKRVREQMVKTLHGE